MAPDVPAPRDPWSVFAHDPRDPAHADLRASDADREHVRSLLGDAYADGRLDREEFDERSDGVGEARTLGALPPLVADLLPRTPSRSVVPRSEDEPAERQRADIARQALEHWETQRRNAVMGFVGPTLICTVIWITTASGAFPWPAIVAVVTAVNLVRTLASRTEIIRDETRRLEKRAAKKAARPTIPPPPEHPVLPPRDDPR